MTSLPTSLPLPDYSKHGKRTKEEFWFCCRCCSHQGGWRDGLTRCLTCEHDRCIYCTQEWHVINDTIIFNNSEATKLNQEIVRELTPISSSTGSSPFKLSKSSEESQPVHEIFDEPARRVNDTPSTSVDSMAESEGERLFMYNTPYSQQNLDLQDRSVRSLASSLAHLALTAFIKTFFREVPADASNSSNNSNSWRGQVTPGASIFPASSTSSTKRAFISRKGSEDPDEHDEGGSTKKPYRPSQERAASTRLLACPYYRFDVDRYSERNLTEICYRGCSSAYIRDVSRLKQHLYRVHKQPEYYCGRCNKEFTKQETLNAHSRAKPPCEVEEPLFREKMDNDKKKLIHICTRGLPPHTEWLNIYRILFPEASPPHESLAYADADSSKTVHDFLTYFEAEGPVMMSSLVHNHLNGRIFLSEEARQILDESVEQAASRMVTLLRPRLEGAGLSSTNQNAGGEQRDAFGNEVALSHAFPANQELPALEDTLYLDDLELDFDPNQWFNPDEIE